MFCTLFNCILLQFSSRVYYLYESRNLVSKIVGIELTGLLLFTVSTIPFEVKVMLVHVVIYVD